MGKLSEENKINILEGLLVIVKQDHPEFDEEGTTGWDVIENAKIWLDELKRKEFERLFNEELSKPETQKIIDEINEKVKNKESFKY